jgi:hypothetical protein
LIPAWVVAGPVLAYLPVTVQRRLLEGIFVPLCLLAVMGLRLWWISLNRRFHRRGMCLSWRLAVFTVLALTLPTTLILLRSGVSAVQQGDPASHLFHTDAEIAALDWLNTHVPAGSVVLSDFYSGNYLPARADVRAFIGHSPETVCLDVLPGSACTVSKRDLVDRLFAGQMSADERRSLFSGYGIRYIIFPQGRADDGSPDLSLIYDENDYHIYAVNR